MGHGLGGLMANHFLESMTDAWKLKYVHVFVPVAVPWAGYVKALSDYETGGFFKTPLRAKLYRGIYQTWETAKLLLPLGQAWEWTRFFNDSTFSLTDGYWLREGFKKMVQPRHPGVNIISLCSTDVPTINSIKLHKYTYSKHTFGYGDGDGTVNKCSLFYNHHLNPGLTGFTHNIYHGYKYNHQEVLSSVSMISIMKHING